MSLNCLLLPELDVAHYVGFAYTAGTLTPVQAWLNIALGIVLCFFGARLFSVSLVCFSGAFAALGSYLWLAARFETLPAMVIAVIVGLLCALVIHSLLRVGFFILGLLLGGSIGGAVLGDSIWVVVVMLASAIMCMLMYRVFILIISSGCGALLLSAGLLALSGPWLPKNPYLFPGLTSLLFIAGMFFQAGYMRTDTDRED